MELLIKHIEAQKGKLQAVLNHPQFSKMEDKHKRFISEKVGEIEAIQRRVKMPEQGVDIRPHNTALVAELNNLVKEIHGFFSNR